MVDQQVLDQLIADLRAARAENKQLRQQIADADFVIQAGIDSADGDSSVDELIRSMLGRIRTALGGGSGG